MRRLKSLEMYTSKLFIEQQILATLGILCPALYGSRFGNLGHLKNSKTVDIPTRVLEKTSFVEACVMIRDFNSRPAGRKSQRLETCLLF